MKEFMDTNTPNLRFNVRECLDNRLLSDSYLELWEELSSAASHLCLSGK